MLLQIGDLEQFSDGEGEGRDRRPTHQMFDDDSDDVDAPRYRGPIAAAIGLVSRMANGLLGLRGNNRDSAPQNRTAQGCARTKSGLEEILGDDESGSSGRDHIVDRLRKRDTSSAGRVQF